MEQIPENLNKFEIEERIEAGLPIALRGTYHKLRQIKAEDIVERIKSTPKREEHWNSITQPLIGKYKVELTKQLFSPETSSTMSNTMDQNNISMAKTIADAVSEGIAKAISSINESNTNNHLYRMDGFELLNKPTKFNGSRDPFIIDNWIRSINDYKDYKTWNEVQTFKFARTMLSGVAAIWLQNLELNDDNAPTTWIALKAKIIAGFKPTNSQIIFREKIEELQQTTTISQYIEDFLTLKLGIPSMTDDEAVSKFVRHLKSKDARIHIRNLYRGDKCPSMDEAIQAAYIFESARNESGSNFSLLPSTPNASSTSPILDDPMDLSSLREVLNFINTRGGTGSRGFSRVGHRGGYRGRPRGNGFRGSSFRGGGSFRGSGFRGNSGGNGRSFSNGNHRSADTRSCYNCGQAGHLQYNCTRGNQELHYINDQYDNNYYGYNYGYDNNGTQYNDEYDNFHQQNNQQHLEDNNTNRYKSNDDNLIKNNKSQPSKHYSKDSPLILFSVLPSFASFIKPLNIDQNILKKDIEFLLNSNTINNKLPLYRILINGHPCTVLIDSGASANYIHPRLIPYVSQIQRTFQGQSVETANGQQTEIQQVASFSVALGDYTDRIEAYVFATKFDIILGRSWLSQVQPIPNWFTGSWKIKIRNNPNKTTIIQPLALHTIQQKIMLPDNMVGNDDIVNDNVADVSMMDDDNVDDDKINGNSNINNSDDLNFLITAKQLDNLFKKKKVEECYFIDISRIDDPVSLSVLIDTPKKNPDKLSNEEKINEDWINEFAAAYPDVFKGVIDCLPPLRDSVEDMIVLDTNIKIDAKAPYKMSPLELRELKRQLDTLLKQGLLEPTSSKYGTPVLFVKSPAAVAGQPPKLRMVCDFRSVNKATISQRI